MCLRDHVQPTRTGSLLQGHLVFLKDHCSMEYVIQCIPRFYTKGREYFKIIFSAFILSGNTDFFPFSDSLKYDLMKIVTQEIL